LFLFMLVAIFQTSLLSAPKPKPYFDVIIIGAGVSGLAAASELTKHHYHVVILEARNRIGGRVWSINPWGTTLDLGASWLHGINNNPINKLMQQISAKAISTSYNSADFKLK